MACSDPPHHHRLESEISRGSSLPVGFVVDLADDGSAGLELAIGGGHEDEGRASVERQFPRNRAKIGDLLAHSTRK